MAHNLFNSLQDFTIGAKKGRHYSLAALEKAGVGKVRPQNLEQDRVVNGWKVLHDIQAERVAVAAREVLQPVDGAVRAPLDAIRVTVRDEQPVEDGSD